MHGIAAVKMTPETKTSSPTFRARICCSDIGVVSEIIGKY